MPRRTKQEALETKNKILMSALETFYDRGYTRSSLVDIAERIGLTKGAVYWHFKNKQDLLMSLAQEMEAKGAAALYGRVTNLNNLADLKHLMVEYGKLFVDDASFRRYYYVLAFRMEWNEDLLCVKELFDKQQEEFTETIVSSLQACRNAGELEPLIDVRVAAAGLYAMVDGLIIDAIANTEDAAALPDHIDQTVTIYFRGLRSPQPDPQ